MFLIDFVYVIWISLEYNVLIRMQYCMVLLFGGECNGYCFV